MFLLVTKIKRPQKWFLFFRRSCRTQITGQITVPEKPITRKNLGYQKKGTDNGQTSSGQDQQIEDPIDDPTPPPFRLN